MAAPQGALDAPVSHPPLAQSPASHLALPRRVVRVSLGGWALAWDAVVGTVRDPHRLYARGRAIEAMLAEQVGILRKSVEETPRSVLAATMAAVRAPFVRLESDLAATGALAEEELERQVDLALARLGIPTRERILRLGREIDALTARIDRELERLAADEAAYSM